MGVVDRVVDERLAASATFIKFVPIKCRDAEDLNGGGFDTVVAPVVAGGVDMTRLRLRSGSALVIVADTPGDVLRAAAAGASVLAAGAHRRSIDDVLVAAAHGRTLWAPTPCAVATKLPRGLPMVTRREAEVLNKILDGQTAHSIADRLVVSPETVKTHTRALLRKFGVANRTELVCRVFGHLMAIGDRSAIGSLPLRGTEHRNAVGAA